MSHHEEYRPFFYFHDTGVLLSQLAVAAGGLAISAAASLVAPVQDATYSGLIAVASMPFVTYAVIGYHAWRGTLQAQRWRSARQKKQHQWEEFYHYFLRVAVAFSAGQFFAQQLSVGAEAARWLLPSLLYVAQGRAYHDMHVIMHIRGQRFEPAEATFKSRDRAYAGQKQPSPQTVEAVMTGSAVDGCVPSAAVGEDS